MHKGKLTNVGKNENGNGLYCPYFKIIFSFLKNISELE